ncbi:MAG: hypothetical protein V7603_6054 [Micromonosporaceae bacterium]
MSDRQHSGEVTGLATAQTYAAGMNNACTSAAADAETFAAVLAGQGVVGAAAAALGRAQELTAAAGAAWADVGAALDRQQVVKEAYAAVPVAGSKQFVTDTSGGDAAVPAAAGSQDVTGHGAPTADETPTGRIESQEIPPQWPGHKPRRRWEWKACAHRPGDRRHVQVALPGVDLATEQAIRTYVQAAFELYDWVELFHWYSGTELTFTRQPDGSAHAARRQIRPTYGSPLRAAYDAANPWTRGR